MAHRDVVECHDVTIETIEPLPRLVTKFSHIGLKLMKSTLDGTDTIFDITKAAFNTVKALLDIVETTVERIEALVDPSELLNHKRRECVKIRM